MTPRRAIALISDIHANLEALQAVLDHIATQNVAAIYCLGDVVGYGPNPRECLDLVLQHCNVCLLGDHDATFLHELAALRPTTDDDRQRANILRSWPLCLDEEHLYLHASPRDPLHEYVFPEDIHNQAKLTSIFARFARHCFAGHTHLPGVFTERREFFTPAALDHRYPLGPQKALINVGSVGQPRDGDPRACYAVLADGLVTFQRVDYPRQRTIEKIGPQPPSDG